VFRFGYAVFRAGVLPRWSGVALVGTQGLPEAAQLFAAGVRDLGIAGMGAGLLAAGPASVSGA
jgi:hypothetical protein